MKQKRKKRTRRFALIISHLKSDFSVSFANAMSSSLFFFEFTGAQITTY